MSLVEGSSSNQRKRWPQLEAIAWCVLALLAAAIVPTPSGKLPHITPDSCQYLSAAHHLRSMHRMQTSLVHFDTESSHGIIPAPLTWFPPGYPAAIALVSLGGCDYETAALLISISCFVFVAGGVWCIMQMLDPSLWAARAAVLCWIINSHALFFSGAVLSESMFTFLSFAGLLFLVNIETSDSRAGIYWVGSAVMAGLSYWVRYAGLLWVVTFLIVISTQVVFRKKTAPSWRTAIVAATSLVLLIAPLMLRNVLLVGDWKGAKLVGTLNSGNSTRFLLTIRAFAISTSKLLFHLVFGDATISHLWLPMAFISIGLIGVCVVLFATGITPLALCRQALFRMPMTKNQILLAAPIIYSTGIAAIAFRSVISYSPRLYVPVLPHFIIVLTSCVVFMMRRLQTGWPRSVGHGIVVCLLLGYGAGNSISRAAPQRDEYQKTQEALLLPNGAGLSVVQELEAGEVIAATNGQIAGYILKHPTRSLVGHSYSAVTWNEQVLRTEMARFGATHLLLFRDAAFDPVVQESQFLIALTEGQTVPWLRLVTFNRDINLYRVQ